MKHILLPLVSMLFIASAAHALQPRQGLNAEPVKDKPHHYTLAIRFDTIDDVQICSLRSAEAAGANQERTTLPAAEWRFDRAKNTIDIDRTVNPDTHIVCVSGRYALPLRITPAEKTDPSTIRFVLGGRIGREGTDFRFDSSKNEIILLSCTSGDEEYIVLFSQPSGSASVGSSSAGNLTRALRAHLGWPLDGNMKPLDKTGNRFAPTGGNCKNVWLVQLLPSADGYTGKDLLSGFRWDSAKNELTLDEAIDLARFSVMVIGDPQE